MQVFIDDSAEDDGEQRLFLCGLINSHENWKSFSTEWEKELKSAPSISYFKMSEAQNLGGEFRGWNEEDKNKKVLALAHIIKKHSPLTIACSLSRKEYKHIITPVAPHNIGNPYFLCFHSIIITTARMQNSIRKDSPKLQFIFDEQGELGNEAAMFSDYIKDQQSAEVKAILGEEPSFANDKEVFPLQAADMLAWHIRRNYKFPNDQAAESIRKILTSGPYHGEAYIQAETLKSIAKGLSKVPNVSLLQNKNNWKKVKKQIRELEELGIDPSKIKRGGIITKIKNWWQTRK